MKMHLKRKEAQRTGEEQVKEWKDHLVMHVGCVVLDEEAQRPRQQQQRGDPEDHVSDVPRGPFVVPPCDHKLPERHVSKIQSLPHLHIVIPPLVLLTGRE